jgi:hypothetical protein
VDKKIIFLHIPKTAGTSLRQMIEKEYPAGACLFLYYPAPFQKNVITEIQTKLPRAKVLYGHFSFGIHRLLGIKGQYVAFLRNPIDRVISFYHHNARQPDMRYYAAIQDGMSLLDMLESHKPEVNNHITRIIATYGKEDMLDDTKVLEQALENIEKHFCFIGLVERFTESVNLLGQQLGWRTAYTTVPYLNVIPTKPLFFEKTLENLERHIHFRGWLERVTHFLNRNQADSKYLNQVDEQTQIAIEKYNRLDILLYQRVSENFLT